MKLKQKDLCFATTDTPDIFSKDCVFYLSVFIFVLMYLFSVLYFFVFEYRVIIYMWVCFHFTAFVSQPSEVIPEKTTLDVQNGYVEF